MKRLFLLMIFISIILGLSCQKKNSQKIYKITNASSSNINNSLCDSIYQGEYSYTVRDTIINEVKYAYAMLLTKGHILGFREYNKKSGLYECVEFLIDGERCGHSENKEDFYVEPWIASPSNRFVIYHIYRQNINESGEEIIFRFFVGKILDVEKREMVGDLYSGDVGGDWTYCDQYIVDGEVVFNPNK